MSPAERVRVVLAAERSRGVGFNHAWRKAKREALAAWGGSERAEWQRALSWSRRYFERAYLREDPAPGLEHALAELAGDGATVAA